MLKHKPGPFFSISFPLFFFFPLQPARSGQADCSGEAGTGGVWQCHEFAKSRGRLEPAADYGSSAQEAGWRQRCIHFKLLLCSKLALYVQMDLKSVSIYLQISV